MDGAQTLDPPGTLIPDRGGLSLPSTSYRTIVWRVTGFSGLGPSEPADRFSDRLVFREMDDLREYSDGLLTEYLVRLRREIVMLTPETEDWWKQNIQRRYEQTEREMRWRERASQMGGAPINRDRVWRDRIDLVRQEVDLARLIAFEQPGARLIRGNHWVCCCPFHQDRNPSLDIDDDKGVWYCRSCLVGGDCFSFAMLKYGLPFREAVIHLEQRLGISTDG